VSRTQDSSRPSYSRRDFNKFLFFLHDDSAGSCILYRNFLNNIDGTRMNILHVNNGLFAHVLQGQECTRWTAAVPSSRPKRDELPCTLKYRPGDSPPPAKYLSTGLLVPDDFASGMLHSNARSATNRKEVVMLVDVVLLGKLPMTETVNRGAQILRPIASAVC
jgi:hypothetical protein